MLNSAFEHDYDNDNVFIKVNNIRYLFATHQTTCWARNFKWFFCSNEEGSSVPYFFFFSIFSLFSCFELCLLFHNNFSFFAFRISSSWAVFIWGFQYIDWFLKFFFTLSETLSCSLFLCFFLISRFGFSLYCHFWYIHANLKYCLRFFFLFNFTSHMIQFFCIQFRGLCPTYSV